MVWDEPLRSDAPMAPYVPPYTGALRDVMAAIRRGPEGVGLGAIQIVRHDGRGGLTIEDRPFALQVDNGMVDNGMIDLGIVAR